MTTVEYILEKMRYTNKQISSWLESTPTSLFKLPGIGFSFLTNFALNILEDLKGISPRARKTNDPAFMFVKGLQFDPMWDQIRSGCKDNEPKMALVLQKMLETMHKNTFVETNLNKVWQELIKSETAFDTKFVKKYNIDISTQKTFPLNLQIKNRHILAQDVTLDDLINILPEIINGQENLISNLQNNFVSAKKLALQVCGKDDSSNLDANKIVEIIRIFPWKDRLSPDMPNLENIQQLLAQFRKQLKELTAKCIELTAPLVGFLLQQFSRDSTLNLVKNQLEKSFQELVDLKFEKNDAKQEIIEKLEKIRKFLMQLLNTTANSIEFLSGLKFFDRGALEEILGWFTVIDTLNDIFPGMGWDLTRHSIVRVALENIIKYSNLVQQLAQLQEIAELLGRLEGLSAIEEEWKLSPYIPHEIYDLHKSDDLHRVIPSELAKLANSRLKFLFYSQWLDHNLMTYRFRGEENVRSHQGQQEKRGPVIICIDTSGSMSGIPEQVAKALSLAVLRIASKEYRNVHIILFSGSGQYKDFTVINQKHPLIENGESTEDAQRHYNQHSEQVKKNYESILDLLSLKFGGGTDFRTPLSQAAEMLRQKEFQKADVLFVSDGISFIDAVLSQTIEEIKAQGARIFTLLIGGKQDVVSQFSDYLYQVAPYLVEESARGESQVGQLLRQIKMMPELT